MGTKIPEFLKILFNLSIEIKYSKLKTFLAVLI